MKLLPGNPFHVEVCLSLNARSWNAYMKQRDYEAEVPQDTLSVTGLDEGCTYIILHINRDFLKLPNQERLGSVAHEAVHIWQLICRHIGETEPGLELEANSVEWIFNWVCTELRKEGWIK